MKTVIARNVNDALQQGISLIKVYGEEINSRVGMTLEIPSPVATTYQRPWERVLINKERDANPFFHLMESLWILAARHDTGFLCEFNKRMVDYSDNGATFNAPYGYRLRRWMGIYPTEEDQLSSVINILKKDPNSRQAVCQIWDVNDLNNKTTKDKACNMSIVFRIRNGRLCMVVYNRSNDMIWGAYGANSVQFSMIQEYVAASIGVPMGEYTQVTNSYHVYTEGVGGEVWNRIKDQSVTCENVYVGLPDLVSMRHEQMPEFEHDLKQFFSIYDQYGLTEVGEIIYWESDYFRDLILPVLCVFLIHKKHGANEALNQVFKIKSDDWAKGCYQWLEARVK